tara:strand:- start:877 stop:1026 length:150 start_codon:yes stop_codon:yes gene_type:complete
MSCEILKQVCAETKYLAMKASTVQELQHVKNLAMKALAEYRKAIFEKCE